MVPSLTDPGDDELDRTVDELRERARGNPSAAFGTLVRLGLDEVLDGPRTGRWDFGDLEKTEKTYVGTKVEILVRARFGFERGARLDLDVDGVDVDVKWAMDSAWQIPEEAVGELCLCVGGRNGLRDFQVGVVRCDLDKLNLGRNKDRKGTLSARGRAAMVMLVPLTSLPPNFVAEMDPQVRARVVAESTIQRRVTALFKALPYTPIPRDAVRTIARTDGDPIRRTRADAGRPDPLEGMRIFSAKYGNPILEALGRPRAPANTWTAVPVDDLKALPVAQRRRLGL